MITELFEGITDILSEDYSLSDKWCQVGYMSTYFNKLYGFQEHLIHRRRDIIIPGSPKIILVLANNPMNSMTAQLYKCAMIGGVPSIVIMINQNALEDGNVYDQIHCITHTAWYCSRAANTYTIKMLLTNKSDDIIDSIYYTPALLTVALIDKLYTRLFEDQIIAASLNSFYDNNVTVSEESIHSIREAIKNEGGIKALIDNNLFCSIDDNKYPGARFADIQEAIPDQEAILDQERDNLRLYQESEMSFEKEDEMTPEEYKKVCERFKQMREEEASANNHNFSNPGELPQDPDDDLVTGDGAL